MHNFLPKKRQRRRNMRTESKTNSELSLELLFFFLNANKTTDAKPAQVFVSSGNVGE